MKPYIDHLGLILLNWCLVEYRVVCLVTRVHLPSKSPMKIIIPLDCKNREKIKVSNPQYMGYNPYKWRLWVPDGNESAFRHLHNKNQRKLFNAMLTLDLYPPRVETMFHLKMGQRHPGMARRWSELGNHLNHGKLTANLPMKIVRNPNRKGSCSNHLVSGAFARGLKGVRYISAFSNLGSVLFGTVSTTPINSRLPWEPITFIFKAYNPYVRGLKPSYVHGFEVQGYKLGFPRG